MRITFFVLTLTTAATAHADPTPEPAVKTLGIDGGIALPTGDWGDAVGFGIGALARFEVPLQPALTFTARAGYIQHMGKDRSDGFGNTATLTAAELPLLGGLRYAFSQQPTSQIYGAAELGLVISYVSLDSNGMSMSDSKSNFGMSLGAGYRAGALDLRGGLLFPDLGHVGDAMAVMATVGYELAAM